MEVKDPCISRKPIRDGRAMQISFLATSPLDRFSLGLESSVISADAQSMMMKTLSLSHPP